MKYLVAALTALMLMIPASANAASANAASTHSCPKPVHNDGISSLKTNVQCMYARNIALTWLGLDDLGYNVRRQHAATYHGIVYHWRFYGRWAHVTYHYAYRDGSGTVSRGSFNWNA